MSKFDKNEMEIYPLITLSYAFPEFVQNFKKSESPDWSDVVHEIGIEIARSEDEDLGFATYFSNQYIGKEISDISERDWAQFQGEIYCDKGKIWAKNPIQGLGDGQRYISLALKSESPDWSDVEHETGIDIARSEDEDLGFTTHFSNQYIGKARSGIPERNCVKFQGEIYCDKGKIWAIKPIQGLEDGQRHIFLALSRAEGKLELLNKAHFRVFHTNCLYLYMTFPLSDDDCYVFLQEYSRICEKFEHSYRFVFLKACDRIICLDFKNGILSTYVFSSEEKSVMDDDVHLLRKISSWRDSSPFEYEVKQIERGYCKQVSFDELERNLDNEIAHQQYNKKYNKECFTL